MMKRRTSLFVAFATLLSAVLVALAMATPARADDYKYTVRVFSGNRGTLSSDPVVKTFSKGESVNLYDIATATITDDKYVQTGFRLSGTDKLIGGNGTISGISEDMDFVVAYGVEGDLVSYTLRFVEYQTGRELAASRTYYGRAGDKPVAAFEYIEGYRPLYLAITSTLQAGEENVWTFEYVPLAEGETFVTTTTNTTTTVVPAPGTTTTYTTEAGTAGTTAEGAAAGTTAEGGAAGTTAEGGAAAATTEGGAAAAGAEGGEAAQPATQEILDLDTPLAGPDSQNGQNGASFIVNGEAIVLSTPALVAGGAIVAAAAAGLIFFIYKLKKGKKDDEEEEETA